MMWGHVLMGRASRWGRGPYSAFCHKTQPRTRINCAEAQTAAISPELYGNGLEGDEPHRPIIKPELIPAHIKLPGCVKRWQPCTLCADNESKLARARCMNEWGNTHTEGSMYNALQYSYSFNFSTFWHINTNSTNNKLDCEKKKILQKHKNF